MATKGATAERPLEAVEAPKPADPPDVAPEAQPEDLNKATVTLEWKGLELAIPKRRGRWPVRALREFNRGRNIEGLVAIIGEENWARLELLCPTADDFEEFSDHAGATIDKQCIP